MNVVLIVEDEEIEQDFLKSIALNELSPEDTILTCESGVQAIELARQYRPNVIIMDIMISETDGLTAIKEIRSFLPNTCITILSAYSDFTYAQKAIRLKVFEYLSKPVKPSLFKEVFQKMLDSVSNSHIVTNDSRVVSKNQCKDFIKESIKYINKNFNDKLTLESVASTVYMNPKYFSQAFKNEMGIAFTDYIIQLRVQYACRLLETTKYPVYRISAECGFSDPSYFNRVFCAQMNITPKAYRTKLSDSSTKIP